MYLWLLNERIQEKRMHDHHEIVRDTVRVLVYSSLSFGRSVDRTILPPITQTPRNDQKPIPTLSISQQQTHPFIKYPKPATNRTPHTREYHWFVGFVVVKSWWRGVDQSVRVLAETRYGVFFFSPDGSNLFPVITEATESVQFRCLVRFGLVSLLFGVDVIFSIFFFLFCRIVLLFLFDRW